MIQRVRGHGGASSVCSMHGRSSPGLLDGRYCGIAVRDDDEPDGGNGARLCMQELDEMEVAMNRGDEEGKIHRGRCHACRRTFFWGSWHQGQQGKSARRR